MFNDVSWIDFGYVLFFGYSAAALRLASNFRSDNQAFKLNAIGIFIEVTISTGMTIGVIGAYMYLHFQKTSLLLFSFGATLAYEPILNLFRAYFINRASQVLSSTGDSNICIDPAPKP